MNCLIMIIFLLLGIIHSQPTTNDNCLVFNASLSAAGTCYECVPGFYLVFFFCLPCAPLCICNSSANFCLSCRQFNNNNHTVTPYFNQTLKRCLLCDTTMSNCLSCNNSNTCTMCYNGYILNKITNMCSPNTCTANCQICKNNFTCSICSIGYSLNKVTQACFLSNTNVANCLILDSDTGICNNCTPTYFIQQSNNTCQPCMANCITCNSSTNCLSCIPGYGFQGGSCQDTGLSNCVAYAAQFSVCLFCQPGYYMQTGSCNQCSGCNECTSSFICLTPCLEGYSSFNYNCLGQSMIKYGVLIFMLIFGILL